MIWCNKWKITQVKKERWPNKMKWRCQNWCDCLKKKSTSKKIQGHCCTNATMKKWKKTLPMLLWRKIFNVEKQRNVID
jgi:hypothetical protein